ncbi:3864_t:CDS:2, partial [Dentiscutata erythropus]
ADKENYINYYNTILERNLLSDNGTMVADNVLMEGYVSQLTKDLSQISPILQPMIKHLRLFNEHVANDQRTTQ